MRPIKHAAHVTIVIVYACEKVRFCFWWCQICFLHLYNQPTGLMHARLKQFLTMENLSPARFAEVMGIQRSGISHLLAGRNKPSFEFIQKMMSAYPEINYEWLILGKGRPYKNDRPPVKSMENTDLFTESPEDDTAVDPSFFAERQLIDDEFSLSQPAENRILDTQATIVPPKSSRKITRIIVFFDDGTYEEK